MKRVPYLFLLVALTLLPACSKSTDTGSSVEPVLEAMLTCPNEDLFDPDSITTIGLGVDDSVDQETIRALHDSMAQTWENQFASFFTEDGFDAFVSSGCNIQYHAMASVSDSTMEVSKIETAGSDDSANQFTYTVSLSVKTPDQTQHSATVDCVISLDDGGKIDDLTITNDDSLRELLSPA